MLRGRVADLARRRNWKIGSLASFSILHRISFLKVSSLILLLIYMNVSDKGFRISEGGMSCSLVVAGLAQLLVTLR